MRQATEEMEQVRIAVSTCRGQWLWVFYHLSTYEYREALLAYWPRTLQGHEMLVDYLRLLAIQRATVWTLVQDGGAFFWRTCGGSTHELLLFPSEERAVGSSPTDGSVDVVPLDQRIVSQLIAVNGWRGTDDHLRRPSWQQGK